MLLFVLRRQGCLDRIIQTSVWRSARFQLTEIKLEIGHAYLNVLLLGLYTILLSINPEFVLKSAKMIHGDFNPQDSVSKMLSIVALFGLTTPPISVFLSAPKLQGLSVTLQHEYVFPFALMDLMPTIKQELVLRLVHKTMGFMIHLLTMTQTFVRKSANKMEPSLTLKLSTGTVF